MLSLLVFALAYGFRKPEKLPDLVSTTRFLNLPEMRPGHIGAYFPLDIPEFAFPGPVTQ